MRTKKNMEIREYAREKKVYLWEIGQKLGVNAFTMTRRMRSELSDDQKARIIAIIDEIATEGATENASTKLHQ